ncbi:hypothetical protein D1871_06685 [Nakamurella silvestris]|nr:hypothetical protein D1871_06685 [Nakamurella silvestris]
MAENNTGVGTEPRTGKPRRRMNLVGLVMAVIFAAISTVAWRNDSSWLIQDGAKFAFAGIIAVVGLYLLFGSRRRT